MRVSRITFTVADAEGVFLDPLAIHKLDADSEDEERFIAVGIGTRE